MKGPRRLFKENPTSGPDRKNREFTQDLATLQEVLKFEWTFFTFTIPNAVTNYKIAHDLGFIPTDILITQQSGGLTFNFTKFDDKFLDVTTTGSVLFRGLIGRYREVIE